MTERKATAVWKELLASQAQWVQLIEDIKALRLDTFDIADRLRSWRAP